MELKFKFVSSGNDQQRSAEETDHLQVRDSDFQRSLCRLKGAYRWSRILLSFGAAGCKEFAEGYTKTLTSIKRLNTVVYTS